MHRFFAEQREAGICLRAEDAVHALRVLRLTSGDAVEIVLDDARYRAAIQRVDEGTVWVQRESRLPDTEPRIHLTLFQGVPKAEKLEWIVQKTTELGVCEVIPVLLKRCVARPEERRAQRQTERLRKIAEEAVKQSGRIRPPRIESPASLSQLREAFSRQDLLLIPWEEETPGAGMREMIEAFLADHSPQGIRIGLVVGPEGGIAPEEMEALRALGGRSVSLGPRILRTETAAITAVALALAYAGEL